VYGFHGLGYPETGHYLLAGYVADGIIQLRAQMASGWEDIPLVEGYFLYPITTRDRLSSFEITFQNGTKRIVTGHGPE
jgi:hypothetical protein